MLSSGCYWVGTGIGAKKEVFGEICFNVSMTGYQEILTDPSYYGQIIVFTFPHIGIVGCNDKDNESKQVYCSGIVIRELPTDATNYISQTSLNNWLIDQNVSGISNIDTRAITRKIRDKGAVASVICPFEKGQTIDLNKIYKKISNKETLLGKELTSDITTKKVYQIKQNSNKYHVVVIDYGVKKNILNCLSDVGFNLTVVPSTFSFEEIMKLKPDGIFLSNGPGDPFATFELTGDTIRKLIKSKTPVFGICLGNQLIALACGLSTLKLHKGHRGSNHPVKNLNTGLVEITTQNHGFCVSKEVVPQDIDITHESLFDHTIEGIRKKDGLVFGLQYHPEASPGPHDSHYLFKEFYQMVAANK